MRNERKSDREYILDMLNAIKECDAAYKQCRRAKVPSSVTFAACGMHLVTLGECLLYQQLSSETCEKIALSEEVRAYRNMIAHQYSINKVKAALKLLPELKRQLTKVLNELQGVR